MWKNCRRQISRFYDVIYGTESCWNKGEKINYMWRALGLVLFLSFFFYRSLVAFPFLVPIGIFYLYIKQKQDHQKKQQRLRRQFKDMITILVTNIRAGYAIENAIKESYKELLLLYDKKADICLRINSIIRGLQNNFSTEELLQQFAVTSKLEEIQEFADVFCIAMRSGGKLTDIMNSTLSVISKKIDVEEEIQVMIAAKEFELKIMNLVPFGIVFYINFVSPHFFDILYHSFKGIAVMSVCMAMYLMSYLIGKKLIQIKI